MNIGLFANLISAFISVVKTYAGFGIIVLAALLVFAAVTVLDRRKNKRQ